jgi:hypothetical protein
MPLRLEHIDGYCASRSSAIQVDPSGNVWIAGRNYGDWSLVVSPFQALGLGAGFLTEMDPTVSKALFSTLLDSGNAVALDIFSV